jgi:hypothetical protein
MVTVVPATPLVGENELMEAGGIYVKPVADVPVPPSVVTVILPVLPLATTAVIALSLTTVNEAAAVPPKLIAVAPVKYEPLIVTDAPVTPVAGVNELTTGAGINVNAVAEDPAPLGAVTVILPVVPPATTAVIILSDTTVYEAAAVPPKLTAVAPVNLDPFIVTVVPAPALVGKKELTEAGGI